MGLKTTNYKVKSMNNFLLPNAYAFIVKCHSERTSGYAEIGVFADRESALQGAKPFEVKRVDFIVDRNENDRATAYRVAKTPLIVKNHEGKEEVVSTRFEGWVDDIVTAQS
jgi:hypothetical protein